MLGDHTWPLTSPPPWLGQPVPGMHLGANNHHSPQQAIAKNDSLSSQKLAVQWGMASQTMIPNPSCWAHQCTSSRLHATIKSSLSDI